MFLLELWMKLLILCGGLNDMPHPKYLIDTSVFIRREPHQIYEEECYPIHWKNFDKLVKNGTIISINKVKKELVDLSHDFYKEWVEENKDMFCPDFDSETTFYLKELSTLFPGWYKENESKADSLLIAFAKVKNLVLVTHETIKLDTKNDKKYSIPTVAYKIGAKCIVYDHSKIYCKDEGDFSFECICFNELVKREKLFEL